MSNSNTETYDLVIDGKLVPIQNLSIVSLGVSGPPVFAVSFTGSPEIAAIEGDTQTNLTMVEVKGGLTVGSADFGGNPFSYTGSFNLTATPGTYDLTSFGRFYGEFDAGEGRFSGGQIGQPISDGTTVTPFAAVTLANSYPSPYEPFQDMVTITPSSVTNGVLSDPNQATDGGYFLGDSDVLIGTGSELTTVIDALRFTPTRNEVPAGQTVSTVFTLVDENPGDDYFGYGGTSTEVASVIATATPNTHVTYIDGPSSGHAVLTGTDGADIIDAHGVGNIILAKNGDGIINAGDGGAIVLASGGDDDIRLGGDLNLVTGGNGNDIVTGAPGGLTAVTLGNGNDVVDLGGNLDHVLLGNGDDRVYLTGGMSFISIGSGNDDVTVTGSDDTINPGGGLDEITALGSGDTFVLPQAFKGFVTINGNYPYGGVPLSSSTGDKLDLRSALSATSWNGSAATLGRYLHVDQVTQNVGWGASFGIAISPHGSGAGQQVALLTGENDLTLAALLRAHALIT